MEGTYEIHTLVGDGSKNRVLTAKNVHRLEVKDNMAKFFDAEDELMGAALLKAGDAVMRMKPGVPLK